MSINLSSMFNNKLNAALLLLLISAPAWGGPSRHVSVVNGVVKFSVATNIPAITVDGQSNQMTAELVLDASGPTLDLQDIRVVLSPQTLTTGMGLRDRHMRNKIFLLPDGTIPEIQFVADKINCPKPDSRQEVVCGVSGQLTLKGASGPFAIDLKTRSDGNGYRAEGAGRLKLSAFGIEAPCQLGVCVSDEVKLSFSFKVTEVATRAAGVR